MKRSELKEKLTEIIQAGIGVRGSSFYPPDMIAERVLTEIENVGMLPPEIEVLEEIRVFDGVSQYMKKRKWEEE